MTKVGSGCPRTPVYKQDPRPQPKAPQAESPEISVLLPLGLWLSAGLVSGLSLPVCVLDVKNACAMKGVRGGNSLTFKSSVFSYHYFENYILLRRNLF